MFMNGVLGGLVGITAGADQMSPMDAIFIGAIAGVIIVLGVALIDKLRLDDPVGAVAVHLICGIWGTLAVGIFGAMASFDQFIIQLARPTLSQKKVSFLPLYFMQALATTHITRFPSASAFA